MSHSSTTIRRVYVVVSRSTGKIYAVTTSLDRMRQAITEGQKEEPNALISVSDEPILK